MANNAARLLDYGDAFPRMLLHLTARSSITLPDDLDGYWGVILVYRGGW